MGRVAPRDCAACGRVVGTVVRATPDRVHRAPPLHSRAPAARAARYWLATVHRGDLTIQGNVKPLPSITEILQLVRDNGALRALLPTSNKAQFVGLPEDVVEKLDIDFYCDPERAVTRTVES